MGAKIYKDRIKITFPISELMDKPLYMKDGEGKIVKTTQTIRQSMQILAWMLMWHHAADKMQKFLEDNEEDLVFGDTLIDENGILTVTFDTKRKAPFPPITID